MQRGELMTPLLKVINLEKHPWYAMNCIACIYIYKQIGVIRSQ